MLKQKIIPFSIWCLTGIVASGFFLQSPDSSKPSSYTEQKIPRITFNDSNITQLFSGSSTPTPVSANHSNFTLVGIIYSTQPSLSRVILQSGIESPKKYALNDTAPNNGVISKITKKSFEYSFNGQTHSIDLPKENPSQKTPT